jgi:hypothetical protein
VKANEVRFIQSKHAQKLRDEKIEGERGVTKDEFIENLIKKKDEIKAMGKPPPVKQSRISLTILQNYMLALSIMSNICQRFIRDENPASDNRRIYQLAFREQLERLTKYEEAINHKKYGKFSPRSKLLNVEEDVNISYLVV